MRHNRAGLLASTVGIEACHDADSSDDNGTARLRQGRLSGHEAMLVGVSNLGGVRYSARVFQNGIEPALHRNVYAGPRLGFEACRAWEGPCNAIVYDPF